MILEDIGGFWSTLSSLTNAALLLETDVWCKVATRREENHSLRARNGGKRTKRVVYASLEGEGKFEPRPQVAPASCRASETIGHHPERKHGRRDQLDPLAPSHCHEQLQKPILAAGYGLPTRRLYGRHRGAVILRSLMTRQKGIGLRLPPLRTQGYLSLAT